MVCVILGRGAKLPPQRGTTKHRAESTSNDEWGRAMSESILPYQLVDDQASTRNKILLANIKLLSESSYRDVSLDQIAKVCDIKKQSILYHFKSKLAMTLESISLVQQYHSSQLQSQQSLTDMLDTLIRLLADESIGQFVCKLTTYANSKHSELSEALEDYLLSCQQLLASQLEGSNEQTSQTAHAVMQQILGSLVMTNVSSKGLVKEQLLSNIQTLLG